MNLDKPVKFAIFVITFCFATLAFVIGFETSHIALNDFRGSPMCFLNCPTILYGDTQNGQLIHSQPTTAIAAVNLETPIRPLAQDYSVATVIAFFLAIPTFFLVGIGIQRTIVKT